MGYSILDHSQKNDFIGERLDNLLFEIIRSKNNDQKINETNILADFVVGETLKSKDLANISQIGNILKKSKKQNQLQNFSFF